MKSNTNVQMHGRRIVRILQVAAVVLMSSYCTGPDEQTDNTVLTADEAYLVEAYVRTAAARDLYTINPLESDSLFAALDSTIDTLRIANTIRALNAAPERWLQVYKRIDERLKAPAHGAGLEKPRRGTGTSHQIE